MNWEKIGKISYQIALIVIEWGFKLCAFVATGMALSTKGPLGTKISSGFGSLSHGLRQLIEAPAEFKEISWAARKYHQVGHAEFQESYGLAPIDQLVSSLTNFFVFVDQIAGNFSQNPLVSIIAAIVVFVSLYLLAWVIRFARQKGQGSLLYRFEKRLGDRIFNRKDSITKKRIKNTAKRDSADANIQKSTSTLT